MPRKIDQGGIPPLHFFGERQRPDRPEKVLDRRFVLGDGKIPAELQRRKSRMSAYMYTDGGEDKPKIQIERVKTAGKGSPWRVDIPILEKQQRVGCALMGQKATREKPEVFLRQTNLKIPFTSYRPPWTDATFAPKMVS